MAFGSKELAKLLKEGGKEVIESLTDTPTVKKATPPKAEGPKAKGSSKGKSGGTKKKVRLQISGKRRRLRKIIQLRLMIGGERMKIQILIGGKLNLNLVRVPEL